MNKEPHNLSLSEIRNSIRNRAISSVELTQHMIDRLEKYGPALNCTARIHTEAALKHARLADQNTLTRSNLPLLHGIPLAHKDMIYRKGWPSENGSYIRKEYVPNVTSTALLKLDSAGAIDIGRLNMVEFALGITGHNEITGNVCNPWNVEHISGGSSSGSGAAVAARLIHGSIGSDTGGSIRFPAACCGITGLKPTYSRVSRFGVMPLSHSLDCIGPLAQTAKDCALLLKVIAGSDPNDPSSSNVRVDEYDDNLSNSIKGLTIATPLNHFYDPVTPEVRESVEASIEVLQNAGANIVPIKVPKLLTWANNLNNLITIAEGSSFHSQWIRSRPHDYGTNTLRRFLAGAMCPVDKYLHALRLRTALLKSFADTVFSKAHLLHLPLLPIPVPTIEETDFTKREAGFSKFLNIAGHSTRCINFLGLPAASIPCGFTKNGLPVSFQLVGRPFDEVTILNAANIYQKETKWHTLLPKCIISQ